MQLRKFFAAVKSLERSLRPCSTHPQSSCLTSLTVGRVVNRALPSSFTRGRSYLIRPLRRPSGYAATTHFCRRFARGLSQVEKHLTSTSPLLSSRRHRHLHRVRSPTSFHLQRPHFDGFCSLRLSSYLYTDSGNSTGLNGFMRASNSHGIAHMPLLSGRRVVSDIVQLPTRLVRIIILLSIPNFVLCVANAQLFGSFDCCGCCDFLSPSPSARCLG